MDKIFPNLKEFVTLKDNSFLSIAVKKIQMPTKNLQLLNILSRPKNNGKENILDFGEFSKTYFRKFSQNIFKNYPFQKIAIFEFEGKYSGDLGQPK